MSADFLEKMLVAQSRWGGHDQIDCVGYRMGKHTFTNVSMPLNHYMFMVMTHIKKRYIFMVMTQIKKRAKDPVTALNEQRANVCSPLLSMQQHVA